MAVSVVVVVFMFLSLPLSFLCGGGSLFLLEDWRFETHVHT